MYQVLNIFKKKVLTKEGKLSLKPPNACHKFFCLLETDKFTYVLN